MSDPAPTDSSIDLRRTGLDGQADALRELLTAHYQKADPQAQAYYDELDGIDIDGAVQDDLARLRDPDPDRPLVVAVDDENLVGSVELKRLDPSTAEVKRLYVVPSYRGRGIGRALVERLIHEARTEGFATLRLGVAPFHERARALYRDIGFVDTDRYDASGAPPVDDWGFMYYEL